MSSHTTEGNHSDLPKIKKGHWLGYHGEMLHLDSKHLSLLKNDIQWQMRVYLFGKIDDFL